jgi:hypothetical protein
MVKIYVILEFFKNQNNKDVNSNINVFYWSKVYLMIETYFNN